MDYWTLNLDRLSRIDPLLANRLKRTRIGRNYRVETARNGIATLVHSVPGRPARYLHSKYDPFKEAGALIKNLDFRDARIILVWGLGLGYSLQKLIDILEPGTRVLVIEKSMEVFRLALVHNDFQKVFEFPGIEFWVGLTLHESESRINYLLRTEAMTSVPVSLECPALVSLNQEYYRSLQNSAHRLLLETTVNRNTLKMFARQFYRNVVENIENLQKSKSYSDVHGSFHSIPVLVISAGPSLDKNIQWLRGIQERLVLISTPTAFQSLLSNGIVPDFVVAVDPNPISAQSFNLETIPQKTWLVYDPSVPAIIPKVFGTRTIAMDSNVVLYNWLGRNSKTHGSPGFYLSVAHAAAQFAFHLGGDPVILMGQDLALDCERTHCSENHFVLEQQMNIRKNFTARHQLREKSAARLPALKPALDLFEKPTVTTQSLESFRQMFADQIGRRSRVFNATEGGVPIPGVTNISLREILSREVGTGPCSKRPMKISKSHEPQPFEGCLSSLETLLTGLEKRMNRLSSLHEKIQCTDPRGAGRIIEEFLNDLQEVPDLFELTTGYLYADLLNRPRYTLKATPALVDFLKYSKTLERGLRSLYELLATLKSKIAPGQEVIS